VATRQRDDGCRLMMMTLRLPLSNGTYKSYRARRARAEVSIQVPVCESIRADGHTRCEFPGQISEAATVCNKCIVGRV
jgi:hypothetical protein